MMEVRLAGAQDIELLAEMRLEFLAAVGKAVAPQKQAALVEAFKSYAQKELGGEGFVAVICEVDRQAAGAAVMNIGRRPPKPNNLSGMSGYISNVLTREDYRGRDCGPAMLSRLMEYGAAHGVEEYSLSASKMGRPVYEKLGFEVNPEPMMRRFATPGGDGGA